MEYIRQIELSDGNKTSVYVSNGEEVYIDDVTGEEIPNGTEFIETKEGYATVDSVLANPEDFAVCEDCGEVLYLLTDEYYYTDNGVVCEDCFGDDWFFCEHCDIAHRLSELVEIHTSPFGRWDEPFYVCEDCANMYYYYCDDCERYFESDADFVTTRDGNNICGGCYDDWYHTCDDCGEVVRSDEGDYDEYGDYWYCSDCARYRRKIGSYHSHDRYSLDKYGINGKLDWNGIRENKKLTGVELEIENRDSYEDDRQAMAGEVINLMDDHVYCEQDGSLDDGFEIIFKPHTPEAFKALPLREMLDKLKNSGYTSHDNGDCGLHIHVSNEWFGDTWEEQDDNVSKVVHLYSEQYDFFLKCSRRTEEQANSWARRYACKDFEDAKQKKGFSTGHDVAVNLQNMRTFGTVEFRLGRGTLKYESFMAWYDMHLAIARNAKDIEPNDLDLNKWLKGITDETRDYILARTGKVVA